MSSIDDLHGKVRYFRGCARGVAAAFLLLLSILTVGVKTGAGGVGWKLGAFDEKAPAFGGKRGAVGEKVGGVGGSPFAHLPNLGNVIVDLVDFFLFGI